MPTGLHQPPALYKYTGISTTSNLGLQCVVESYNTLILSVCQQYSKNYLFSVLNKAVLSVVGKVIFLSCLFHTKNGFSYEIIRRVFYIESR